ncbi:MAG: NUDIX domain-containing protein [Lachnospiraceae bacterium]
MEGKLRNMTAIYLLRREKVLLLYRQGGRVVNDVWTGSAGCHFENNELNDAEACMLRELYEELHLTFEDIENMALRYVTLRRTKGEIRQNYYFFANLKEYVDDNLASNEGICKWFSLNEISSLEMPFTAKYVMEHFCAYGRYTDKIYVGISEIDGVRFFDLPYTEDKKL